MVFQLRIFVQFILFCILTFNVLQELSSEADKEAAKILEEQLAAKDEEIQTLQKELEASKVMKFEFG